MKTISGFIFSNLLGWKICGKFPDIKKSVAIIAPHTSGWDAFIGKLYVNMIGIKYYVLAKKELFVFPLGILMRAVRAYPVDRKNIRADYVRQIARLIVDSDEMHILLAPEGKRSRTTNWKKGFYHIARKANVPVIVLYMDYLKKEVGVRGIIENLTDIKSVMSQINEMYRDVSARFPENFALDKLSDMPES